MRLADTEVIDLSDKVVGVPAWVWIVIFILAVFNKYVVPAISNLAKGARNIVELARELRGGVQGADRRRSRRQFADTRRLASATSTARSNGLTTASPSSKPKWRWRRTGASNAA